MDRVTAWTRGILVAILAVTSVLVAKAGRERAESLLGIATLLAAMAGAWAILDVVLLVTRRSEKGDGWWFLAKIGYLCIFGSIWLRSGGARLAELIALLSILLALVLGAFAVVLRPK